MAWHRKHRPRTVAHLHLTNVRSALQQMMEQGKFPQVLLFAGPKGTGKTSASRIIGNLLNDPQNADLVDSLFFGKAVGKQKKFQEPKTDTDFANRIYEGNSYVVQEMDAASYRGIDDIRALKDRVMLPPQEGKMAVYILDEAHMFTTEAFNALLKLLEEPPAHAVFILATTELHKIPATIVSRSTQLNFRKATNEELLAALKFVADAEKLKYEPEALLELAGRADGSFRDAVKLLELVAHSGQVSLKSVTETLGQSALQNINQLLETVLQKNSSAVAEVIQTLREQNVQEAYFYKMLFSTLHQVVVDEMLSQKTSGVISAKAARFLLQELLKANLQQYSPVPFLALELSLLDIVERATQQKLAHPKKKIKNPEKPSLKISPAPVFSASLPVSKVPATQSSEQPAKPLETISPTTVSRDLQKLGKELMEQWEQFLEVVGRRNASLAALLRSGKPTLTEEGLPQVGVFYKFHQEQLQQQKYMNLIQDCAKDVVGASLSLEVALRHTPQSATLVEVEETQENLSELAEEVLL
jgi:DNA polymerase-3 subunit gamma/tau